MKAKILVGISAALIFALIVYLGSAIRSVETLEERLSYREPSLGLSSSQSAQSNDLQMTYVPVYSHIYVSGGRPLLLGATLSIRNTSFENQLEIVSVDYYSTEGRLLKGFIDAPRMLPAMATATYLVDRQDEQGGDGANFVVTWRSNDEHLSPLMEAVMFGSHEGSHVSFTARGHGISRPRPAE
ncbi:MAG: DUF3124 domain-containing protein [Halieaceae bacterium]